MEMKKFIIAGGNPTLLVWGCSLTERTGVIQKFLGDVEQIGFVSYRDKIPELTMMGNEFCVNASIALASSLGNEGVLYSSGIKKAIAYRNTSKTVSITFPMSYSRRKNLIFFPGIGFVILKTDKSTKTMLVRLCEENNLPAFGTITLQQRKIFPRIYVKNTDSLIKETSCGSGSIAASIVSGESEILQPTGEIIKVSYKDNLFTVEASVARMEKI